VNKFSKLSRVAKAGVLAAVSLVPASVFATGGPFTYNTVAPCRLVDTRRTTGVPYGAPPLSSSQANARSFYVPTFCGVPVAAQAVAMNVAVIIPSVGGDLRIYPSPTPPSPLVSTLNFDAGDIIANGAIVPIDGATTGAFTVWYESANHTGADTTNLIVDVTGYFAP
jgi:hypothetical protein